MKTKIQNNLNNFAASANEIPEPRKVLLQKMAAVIAEKIANKAPVKLNFICTENSRRSHISQIWAATLAAHFELPIQTYSGGMKATAMNPRTATAMERAGFTVTNPGGQNPHYTLVFDENKSALTAYSKLYNAPENPQDAFIAIMVCSDADSNCPYIPTAEKRFAFTFNDPKIADDTPAEHAMYDERVAEIGTQVYYLFNTIKHG